MNIYQVKVLMKRPWCLMFFSLHRAYFLDFEPANSRSDLTKKSIVISATIIEMVFLSERLAACWATRTWEYLLFWALFWVSLLRGNTSVILHIELSRLQIDNEAIAKIMMTSLLLVLYACVHIINMCLDDGTLRRLLMPRRATGFGWTRHSRLSFSAAAAKM